MQKLRHLMQNKYSMCLKNIYVIKDKEKNKKKLI
jgi:hypothetical protein